MTGPTAARSGGDGSGIDGPAADVPAADRPPGRRATLKDVAKLSGVSIQTVSNVVNSRVELMTPATRERVREAMRTLRYHPNSQARGLRSHKTHTLAFLLLDPDPMYLADPMTDMMISGVGAVARDAGYMVLVHVSGPEQLDHGLFAPLHRNQVDGSIILLSGRREVRRQYLDEITKLTGNFVTLAEVVEDPELVTVTSDNRRGGVELTRRLIAAGHRRIGFIGSGTSWPMIEERFAGYRAALDGAGIGFDPALTRFDGQWRAETGVRLAAQLCADADPPTALLAGNDLLALGAIRAVRERGLRVPDDVAVAGFDDFEFAAYTDPPLTTVRVPGFEMGRLAATKLIDLVEGRDTRPGSVVLPVELKIRGTA